MTQIYSSLKGAEKSLKPVKLVSMALDELVILLCNGKLTSKSFHDVSIVDLTAVLDTGADYETIFNLRRHQDIEYHYVA
jgi:hypothetical protein